MYLFACYLGYIPNPETSDPVFSAPGRSEEDIKQMLYRTEINVTLFNNALQEAGERGTLWKELDVA